MSSPLVGKRLAGPEPREVGDPAPLFSRGRALDRATTEERREGQREAGCREGEREPQHAPDIGSAGEALELSYACSAVCDSRSSLSSSTSAATDSCSATSLSSWCCASPLGNVMFRSRSA